MQKLTHLLHLLPFALAHPHSSPTPPSLLAPRTTPLFACPSTTVFTYTSLYYQRSTIFSTPAHIASAQEQISFDLINSATSYSIYCSDEEPLRPDGTTSFDGSQGHWCSYLKNGTVYQENFQFDARGLVGSEGLGIVTLVPTWSCLEGGVSEAYMGLGNRNITFQCKRYYWQNPTWQLGQIFSTDLTNCTYEGTLGSKLSFDPPVVPAWEGNGEK